MVIQPIGMHAPRAAYTVFYALLIVGTAGSLGWLAWRARATRSPLPLAGLAGGLVVGVVTPSINDSLTYVWFPSNIPAPYITAFGMRDPLFDLLGTALFYGLGGWLLCEQLRSGRGARAIWLTFAVWACADLALELPFLQWGLYRYYGHQPLQVAGFPLHWVFMNGAVPVVTGVLMYGAIARWPFEARGVFWRVAGAPVIAGGLLLVPMAPVATALHADVASWVRGAAAILSIGISLGAVRSIAGRFSSVSAVDPRPAGADRRSFAPTA
jgi:hypothetical protein